MRSGKWLLLTAAKWAGRSASEEENTQAITSSTSGMARMLINCDPHEDVFARVPALAGLTDPILQRLDCLLDEDFL